MPITLAREPSLSFFYRRRDRDSCTGVRATDVRYMPGCSRQSRVNLRLKLRGTLRKTITSPLESPRFLRALIFKSFPFRLGERERREREGGGKDYQICEFHETRTLENDRSVLTRVERAEVKCA